jgi:hypothetical protein
MCDGGCPTAVPQRMHLHPDPVLPFIQLQSARSTWDPKIPVTATRAPSPLALAPHQKATATELLQDLISGDLQIKFQHSAIIVDLHMRESCQTCTDGCTDDRDGQF